MRSDQVEPREALVRARCDAADFDGAATEAIRLYGQEVFGLLLALHPGDEVSASEVFSVFCEQLWRGLSRFAWQCSLRTWSHVVARNASSVYRRTARRWAKRAVPLSACPEIAEAAERVRTETISALRSDRRQAIIELRATLPQEDQTLLILRVDRGFAWLDLARVFLGDEEDPPPEALHREAARLRKRFQKIKQRLVELGRERGLFGQPER